MTLDKMEVSPGETLYVHLPKLIEGVVIVPGSVVLRFDIDLSGGHANNFLVFYPYALENYLVFKLTLAPASQVVRGSDPT